jgi:hypothetical protein
MSRPNFFIVGQPKSGTTAFYEFLGAHPEIFVPERKEVHYFCTDFHRENAAVHGTPLHFPIRTEADYLALFHAWNGERVVGEASVHYLYSAEAAREIHRFAPDAKILVFLRNPADFLFSWHAHSLVSNGETIESFEEALAAEEDRRQGRRLTSLVKVPSYLHYSARVRYAEQIARFLELFPPERVKVVLYDDFVADIGAVYRDLLEFLEVDPEFVPDFKVVNARKRLRFKQAARFTKLPAVKRTLDALVPKPLREKLGLPRLFAALFHARDRSAPLSPETRRALMERYRGEVQAVSVLLGRDLGPAWGYGPLLRTAETA